MSSSLELAGRHRDTGRIEPGEVMNNPPFSMMNREKVFMVLTEGRKKRYGIG